MSRGVRASRVSVVAERLAEFVGRRIALRLTWQDAELQQAELVAVLPIGKDYFLHLRIGGRSRLVNARAVLELGEVASCE